MISPCLPRRSQLCPARLVWPNSTANQRRNWDNPQKAIGDFYLTLLLLLIFITIFSKKTLFLQSLNMSQILGPIKPLSLLQSQCAV